MIRSQRLIMIVFAIPLQGTQRTAREIQALLEERGAVCALRSVQRDLQLLKNMFDDESLQVTGGPGEAAGYRWKQIPKIH